MSTASASNQAASKAELYRLLGKFNEKVVRYEINRVIKDRRGIPMDEAKRVKTLRPSEVREVLSHFE